MSEQRWFYRTEQEWVALVERLKHIACPYCHRVGALIRHGSLFGFDDQNLRRRTCRARRIFCSNRYRRPGCGRTITAWLAEKIRRSSLTTPTVWVFLRRAVQGSLADAIRTMKSPLSNRTWQHCWKRFDLAPDRQSTLLQAKIFALLLRLPLRPQFRWG